MTDTVATVESPVSPSLPTLATRKRGWAGWTCRLACLALLAWLAWQAYFIFFGANFHAVLPGEVYRSAQTSPRRLKEVVQRHGIRTVINLRGLCSVHDWYLAQCDAIQDLGISQEDLTFSAQRLPPAGELGRLIEVLDQAERPILLHCRQGADRTGLAAVVVRLLYTDDTLEEALWQLSWRYGHLPVAKTLYIDRFFDLYAAWLAEQSLSHAPAVFRRWAMEEYRGGWCQYVFESVLPLQETCKTGEPIGFKVRVRNTSSRPLRFRPHELAGTHIGILVMGPQNNFVGIFRGGLLHKDLAPGESIEVAVVTPPLREPGRYRLRFDMVDEDHCWFEQAGAPAHEEEIIVHE